MSLTYYYERGNQPSVTPLPANFSRHHVVAYPVMYFGGVASLVYLADLKTKGAKEYQTTLDNFSRIVSTVSPQNSSTIDGTLGQIQFADGRATLPNKGAGGHGGIYNILNALAWFKGNLFYGPSGAAREDDPSQKLDNLPRGLEAKTADRLKKMYEAYQAVGKPCLNSIGVGSVDADLNKLYQMAKTWMEEMGAMLGAEIYDSKVSDWGAVQETGTGKVYEIFYSTKVSDTGASRYKYVVQSQPWKKETSYTVVKLKKGLIEHNHQVCSMGETGTVEHNDLAAQGEITMREMLK